MKSKRLSLRFDLEHETDRRVWEQLQKLEGTKNRAVIAALDAYFSQGDLSLVVRQTIQECLQGLTVAPPPMPESSALSPEEDLLLDGLNEFLGE